MQTIQLNSSVLGVFHLWRQPKIGTLLAAGRTVPSSKQGYSPGCLFIDFNAAAGLQVFVNEGTLASCTFTAVTIPGVDLSTLTATVTEINRTADVSTRLITDTGATITITEALHDGKIIPMNRAGGIVHTLPAATGSGARFRFVVLATSTAYVIAVANSSDIMQGTIFTLSDNSAAVIGFTTTGTSDTITLNATTKGGLAIGDWVEIVDAAANTFLVTGQTTSSGTEVTPFSAAV